MKAFHSHLRLFGYLQVMFQVSTYITPIKIITIEVEKIEIAATSITVQLGLFIGS